MLDQRPDFRLLTIVSPLGFAQSSGPISFLVDLVLDPKGFKSLVDCQHGRGYAPKGQTPILRKKAKRFSTNMISSVTNQGKVRWMIYRETLTSEVFIRFMERLIKDSKKKVFLIVDNLRVHHSAPVKEWVEANKERIALFHLPSYSPERNPDEYLNGDLKSELSRKAPPMDQGHLERNLIGSMRRLAKSPKRVASYFEHPTVTYAKAA